MMKQQQQSTSTPSLLDLAFKHYEPDFVSTTTWFFWTLFAISMSWVSFGEDPFDALLPCNTMPLIWMQVRWYGTEPVVKQFASIYHGVFISPLMLCTYYAFYNAWMDGGNKPFLYLARLFVLLLQAFGCLYFFLLAEYRCSDMIQSVLSVTFSLSYIVAILLIPYNFQQMHQVAKIYVISLLAFFIVLYIGPKPMYFGVDRYTADLIGTGIHREITS
jgi:hypothetical protein